MSRYSYIVPVYNPLNKNRYLKVGVVDALDVRLLLSANQLERLFKSEFNVVCLLVFGVLRPTQIFLTHMDTSALPVKDCKF